MSAHKIEVFDKMAASSVGTSIRTRLKDFSFQQAYKHMFNPKITPPRQAWLENFIGQPKELYGIIELHPSVFGVFPRIDFITRAILWQYEYRKVDYLSMPTRNELPGGTKKPWPQKGTGRARHGSVNSPIFLRGGWAHGPRGPKTGFTLIPHFHLVNALTCMLTVKLAQDDLRIVDTLESYSSNCPKELEERFAERGWGPSVLLVDLKEECNPALIEATKSINHVNLMTTVGLNTLSMAKHETMVITYDALREVENRLLHQLVRTDLAETRPKYRE